MRAIFRALVSMLVAGVSFPAAGVSPPLAYVASFGLDSNPCSRVQPCRSFQTAVNTVASGGTVIALTTAGYGTVTINKSVSIVAPTGVYAGISGSGGMGIMVDIPTGAEVILRGLTVSQSPPASGNGVELRNGGRLTVDGLTITGFTGAGIKPATETGQLIVIDTMIVNCGTAIAAGTLNASIGDVGQLAQPFTVDRLRALHNGVGVGVYEEYSGTVRDSTIAYSALHGVQVAGGEINGVHPACFPAKVRVDNSLVFGGNNGMTVQQGPTASCVALANVAGTAVVGTQNASIKITGAASKVQSLHDNVVDLSQAVGTPSTYVPK